MKKVFMTVAAISALFFTPVALASTASAQVDIYGGNACSDAAADSDFCKNKGKSDISPIIKTIIDTLLYIIAIIAVIVIVVSGIKYATSAGDSNKVSSAKNTITYAIVGLVVAIFAYAIVQFIFTKI